MVHWTHWKQRSLNTLSKSSLLTRGTQRAIAWESRRSLITSLVTTGEMNATMQKHMMTILVNELKGAGKELDERAKREMELQARLAKEREDGVKRVNDMTSDFRSGITTLVKLGETDATTQAQMVTTLDNELKGARKERDEGVKREKELQVKLDQERQEGALRLNNMTSHFRSLIASLVERWETNVTKQAQMMTILDNELKSALKERDEVARREKELQDKLVEGAKREKMFMLAVGFLSCCMSSLFTSNAALKDKNVRMKNSKERTSPWWKS